MPWLTKPAGCSDLVPCTARQDVVSSCRTWAVMDHFSPFLMTANSVHGPLLGPSAVAVHNNGHVFRQVFRIDCRYHQKISGAPFPFPGESGRQNITVI